MPKFWLVQSTQLNCGFRLRLFLRLRRQFLRTLSECCTHFQLSALGCCRSRPELVGKRRPLDAKALLCDATPSTWTTDLAAAVQQHHHGSMCLLGRFICSRESEELLSLHGPVQVCLTDGACVGANFIRYELQCPRNACICQFPDFVPQQVARGPCMVVLPCRMDCVQIARPESLDVQRVQVDTLLLPASGIRSVCDADTR